MQTAIQMPSGGCLSSGARARSSARATQQILCAPRRDVVAKARRTKTATTTYTQGERPDADTKAKLFNETVDRITRRFGDGSIMRLSDSVTANIETFPSGSLTLDAALGGGYPRGRIIEVYGPEASGKTTLAMHGCGEIQRLGGTVAYIDVEHAFDRTYASAGHHLNNFWYAQPMTGEEALEVMDELCRSNVCDLVVIDSVAALVPRAELEGDIGSVQIGSQARLLSQALRKLSASASKSKTTLFFINQLRNKIGVMFGNPETTSGGNALKYYSSVRIDIRKKETLSESDQAYANRVRAKVVKNKVASPHKEALFEIYYGRGIDFLGGLIDTAERLKVLTRRGAFYYYGDQRLGQGREKVLAALREDAERTAAIEAAVRDVLRANPDAALVDTEEGDDDDGLGTASTVALDMDDV
uniref:Chloroplast DNA recombination protein RECA n=1 Tax=Chlamydomonas reinhardtii TaxID=3055 RepID=Q948V7_CHLRE|nr:chloroplast DNA recombination protein RECA [Chlamydomonas reinhardtii]